MTAAPDKILVDLSEAPFLCASTFPDAPGDPVSVEYTRTDISDARTKELKARIEKLEALLENAHDR